MTKKKLVELPIRLALRKEGKFWCAYIAEPDSMKKAFLLGSIAIGPVTRDADLKERFQQLMMDAMALGIEEVLGERPDHMEISDAPESERSGHG